MKTVQSTTVLKYIAAPTAEKNYRQNFSYSFCVLVISPDYFLANIIKAYLDAFLSFN
jgi:hypothetical protein